MADELEDLRRVICKACKRVQFKSTADNDGCVECGCTTLSFFRRRTDTVEGDDEAAAYRLAYGNAAHDKAVCDCLECENYRRAEATHELA